MRCLALVLITFMVPAASAQEKPLTAAEASKKVNETCTVELKIESTGKTRTGKDWFLNSMKNYRADDNFTIMVKQKASAEFKEKSKIESQDHFKGKTIRVTGKVTLFNKKPQIDVTTVSQIVIVEAK